MMRRCHAPSATGVSALHALLSYARDQINHQTSPSTIWYYYDYDIIVAAAADGSLRRRAMSLVVNEYFWAHHALCESEASKFRYYEFLRWEPVTRPILNLHFEIGTKLKSPAKQSAPKSTIDQNRTLTHATRNMHTACMSSFRLPPSIRTVCVGVQHTIKQYSSSNVGNANEIDSAKSHAWWEMMMCNICIHGRARWIHIRKRRYLISLIQAVDDTCNFLLSCTCITSCLAFCRLEA